MTSAVFPHTIRADFSCNVWKRKVKHYYTMSFCSGKKVSKQILMCAEERGKILDNGKRKVEVD
jgi:hypothetical protein